MTDAEKAWGQESIKYANECISDLVHPTNIHGAQAGYVIGVSDYKAALRAEIEKKIAFHALVVANDDYHEWDIVSAQSRIFQLNTVLKMLDTVTPLTAKSTKTI